MSSDPNEPENFTLEQMMERLKERSKSDKPEGEWVTRADGSQAYKVRRRRRRSHQPHKDAAEQLRRTRAVQIVSVALVLAVVIALFAGLMVFVNTPGYREQRLALAQSCTGAQAEVVQLRIMPHVAQMASFSLTWPEGGMLRSLAAGQIKAELRPTSLLGKVWRGDEVLAQDVRVSMDQPSGKAAAAATTGDGEKFPFQFQNFRTPKLTLQMGNPKQPAVALSECEAIYRYDAANATGELALNRGKLNVADWGQLQVDRGLFHFAGGRVEVVNLFLIDPGNDRGRIMLTGNVPLQSQAGSLAVKVQRSSLSTLLGSQLGTLMGGVVDTDDRQAEKSMLRVTPGSMATCQLSLALRNHPGMTVSLAGLPCLQQLAEAVSDEWYLKPNFETNLSANLTRRGAETTLQQLEGTAKNRMAIRGDLRVDAQQQLSGTLEFGLPPEIIASSDLPEQLEAVFSHSRDGLQWVTVKLGGSVNQPSDDLAPRLRQLQQSSQSSSTAPKSQKNPNEQRFQELTR